MTAETRTTITLGDLKTVEFECKKCHTRLVRAISDDPFIPSQCPASNCDNKHWFVNGSQEFNQLRSLLGLLYTISANPNPQYDLHFEVKV